ncbi:tyrosine-type recombinase/integrase [Domibacillus indicus]|uniref:tyrosine-type recombinase/integrase n=1 Tax=Domibacillus indicus TaxID=1437523 RepID=UPI00203CF5BC|nr:tyrosine-type recombinase/integrase [Domibacillus indicus]MCM3789943.1 tyrosine-type recombinase/integrase [Domibacillus indicus]
MGKLIIHNENSLLIPENTEEAISALVDQKDRAEREGKPDFYYFNDRDMLHYFLYRETNLNKKANRSKRTIREYEKELHMMIKQMLENGPVLHLDLDIVDDSLFKSLEKRHLRRYQKWVAEDSPHVKKRGSYSPATLERKTVIWKSFFSFLFKSGYIQKPIHEELLTVSVRSEDRPNRDLGPHEVIQLLDYFEERKQYIAFALIHVLVSTGMRNEELCRLTLADVQYDSILGHHYLSVTGKGNKRREIPLKEKVLESILQYRKARFRPVTFPNSSEEPLFVTSTGRAFKPDGLAHYLKRVIKEVDLPFVHSGHIKLTAHVFRHSFAIISHLNKADVFSIMKALGHEDIHTTMIYLQKVLHREHHVIHQWSSESLGKYI